MLRVGATRPARRALVRALGLFVLLGGVPGCVYYNGIYNAQSAAKSVGVFWKTEREFLRQARAWTLPHLDQLQPLVLAADKACKTSGAPDDLIAERLVLTIASRARSLGL